MAGDNPKPAIPAWQRAGQKQDEVSVEKESTPPPSDESTAPDAETPSTTPAAEESSVAHRTPSAQPQQTNTFQAADFETFTQQQAASQPPQQQAQLPPSSAPPIITYPEFLHEAHKPPPLITPSRILTTAYAASGLAALIYGASKYLVSPMSTSLTDARHDFALHSQAKIDELNERLAKLVSVTPETIKDRPAAGEEEAESETSDPTELFHRDMGTQTSPPHSRTVSFTASTKAKLDSTSHQTNVLDTLHSHLAELHSQNVSLGTSYETRTDALNSLQAYVDTLLYTHPSNSYAFGGAGGVDALSSTYDEAGQKLWGNTGNNGGRAQEDPIEELKKEIRGVKGILLSAKRFPGVLGKAGNG